MNAENLVITDVDMLGIAYDKIKVNEAFINSVNDNGIRWVDIYAIAENIKTKESKKIKIKISGDVIYQPCEISDEEWINALG